MVTVGIFAAVSEQRLTLGSPAMAISRGPVSGVSVGQVSVVVGEEAFRDI